ncbi:PrnB family protein [Rhizorhapis suberifaciens]|uniref:Indoleamine 2,3-dioxygenase n=1 Tax=Rhizorhapis suberifaciens TaxID=13656 RepID=A0A840HW82_9SPHN|nr:indoleamine 2,3-dioxygenase [Rhizorhapis suberifaciens]MBB4641877.1 indoleamine 2,3-dioxygenase [Rhizorhapis suberifaciens]
MVTPLKPLMHYGLSADRGFLSAFEADEVPLPSLLAPVVATAERLSGLLTTGRIRHWLDPLPLLDLRQFVAEADEAQVRVAMVRYSFLVQAYVWGERDPPTALPANLAAPIVTLADALGQHPLLPYSAYVLDNWSRIDKHGPIALDNIRMVQNFLGGQDENWFVLVHVAIEGQAGRALELSVELMEASTAAEAGRVIELLIEMNGIWERMNALFDRMPERCDPYIYFQRVRPYIHGWKNNPVLGAGLIYEGVGRYRDEAQAFCGQTGSQSSIVPAMDALFGVTHQNDALREFLKELHTYRPPLHRRFIEDVALASTLRAFCVAEGSAEIRAAFNACVEQVARFRTRHLEYAANYINKQAAAGAGNDTDIGTGGTPFMRYLKKHRDENRTQTI